MLYDFVDGSHARTLSKENFKKLLQHEISSPKPGNPSWGNILRTHTWRSRREAPWLLPVSGRGSLAHRDQKGTFLLGADRHDLEDPIYCMRELIENLTKCRISAALNDSKANRAHDRIKSYESQGLIFFLELLISVHNMIRIIKRIIFTHYGRGLKRRNRF